MSSLKKSFATPEDMLIYLGDRKTKEDIDATWSDIADAINEAFGTEHTDSWTRKRYRQMRDLGSYVPPLAMDTELSMRSKITLLEMEKQRMRVNAEHRFYRNTLRKEMTFDALLENLASSIEQAEPIKIKVRANAKQPANKAVYAMLGDVHYGLAFDHFYGKYNTDIAKQRVMEYAEEIVRIGNEAGAKECFVTLMGDMISGFSHKTIRLENTETVASQIVDVSELVSAFLMRLSLDFDRVCVNAVDGNHSRLDQNIDESLRSERLDHLIVWYCKAKLINIDNIKFFDNTYDQTVADFELYGKLFIAVHGDFDTMTSASSNKIRDMIGRKIDYFLMGHMHVPEMRVENTTYIRNGSITSGGDDYTAKKRLFSPATQICMIVSPKGVESIHTVRLSEEEIDGAD